MHYLALSFYFFEIPFSCSNLQRQGAYYYALLCGQLVYHGCDQHNHDNHDIIFSLQKWQISVNVQTRDIKHSVTSNINEKCSAPQKKERKEEFLEVKSILTIIGVQDLYSSNLWEFKGCHHRLRQNNLKCLGHFILPVWQDPDLPGGFGLAWVKLHLFLRFPPEIFVLFCSAILCANTLERALQSYC